ncbi:MAG: carbon monoxide dehydrogenase subunit G [Austwickia sp.]|nr:carbon monoxide dehydrogenase subunit G [Austwickia sp.]MBK8437825.1 carbon monoxide dehydrogenase subunit G [Austwickia sp.]
MQINGTAHMNAAPDVAWKAFHDPGVLSRTIPGVQRLTETGPDAYALAVMTGIGSIKGIYEGNVAITDQQPIDSFVLRARGEGAAGTIAADVAVRLAQAADGGTDIVFEADANVGGTIGGVGQRMLSGVAKKMATMFFAAIDKDIATGGAQAEPAAIGAEREVVAAGTPGGPALPGLPARVGAAGATAGASPVTLLGAAAVGAAIALAGVAVGAAVAGRRWERSR